MRLGKFEIQTPAVCASIIANKVSSMKSMIDKALKQGADVVELRLDKLQDTGGWQELLREEIPIIVTNRAKREGGYFKGKESERIEFLSEAIDKEVACVDIELLTTRKLLNKVLSAARDGNTNVIISFHDLEKTPPIKNLIETSRQMEGMGCDIAKVVGHAKDFREGLRTLDFLLRVTEEVDVPVVSFAMGDAGRFTRIATPFFGSPLIYAGVDEKAAPGQFDLVTTKDLLRKLNLRT